MWCQMQKLFVLLISLAAADIAYGAPKAKDACDQAAADRKALRMYQSEESLAPMIDITKEQLAKEAKKCGLVLTEPKVGMWYRDVLRSTTWGEPDQMRKTETAAGVDYQLIYGEGRYLYIHNGQVSAIQEQTGR